MRFYNVFNGHPMQVVKKKKKGCAKIIEAKSL